MATEEDKRVNLLYNICANFNAYLWSNLLFIYRYEQVVYVSETSFLSTIKEGFGKKCSLSKVISGINNLCEITSILFYVRRISPANPIADLVHLFCCFSFRFLVRIFVSLHHSCGSMIASFFYL